MSNLAEISEQEAPPAYDEQTEAPDTTQPPHDRKAEEAVLGSVLINPDCYADQPPYLAPADFFIHRHRWIWAAFGNLTARGDPLDLLTISGELTRTGKLEEIGGPAYLTALMNQVPSTLNAEAYRRTVKDFSIKRGMIAAANKIATLAYDESLTADQVSAGALEAVQGQAGSSRPRYQIFTGADALEPQSPTEWVVRNFIQTNSINVFYGDPGSKKTWICLHLAGCVSDGFNWLNYDTEAGPVLFVDEESGQKRLKDRLSRMLRGLGASGKNIHCVSFAGFSLDKPADVIDLENLIKSTGAKLVIFDALADMMTGDENSKQDVQPIFAALRRISDATGAAIVIIHHSGKSGDYRGSSAIKGAADLMLEIKSEDDSDTVKFTTTKNRDSDRVKFAGAAMWDNDVFTLSPTNLTAQTMSKAEDEVMRFFETHPDATVEECENSATACSPATARKTLYALAPRGLLRRSNPGEKIARYRVGVSPVTDVSPVNDW